MRHGARHGLHAGGALASVAFIAWFVWLLSSCSDPGSNAPAGRTSNRSTAWDAPALRGDCERAVNPSSFASADELWALEEKLDSYGVRATGNAQHAAYVDWLESQLALLPGARLRSVSYPMVRWTQHALALEAGVDAAQLHPLAPSGAVPYARPTPPEGVQGALVYVPPGAAIADAHVAGKIVLRDVVPGSLPNAFFSAMAWWSYDPDGTIARNVGGTYERDWLSSPVPDIAAAAQSGAAGIVLMHGLPRSQVQDQYRPYEGVVWPVPALYVGADEAKPLKELAAAGGVARLGLSATVEPSSTRMLIATLPGVSDERIAIESHTDGVNALWDNGPLAMLAMARYFAQFDVRCRPRTLEFVFTTAHLHQHLVPPWRDGSAEPYAQELDRAYQDGRAAAVVVVEHLGARTYTAVPRRDGGPGRELVLTSEHETNAFFVTESPGLQGALFRAVLAHDLRQTSAMRGADVPSLHLPPHQSFGGEGNPYLLHLLPTVAFITAPWTLFTPGYGLAGIDKNLFYKQTLVFTDLIHGIGTLPRIAIAGAAPLQRAQRDLLCRSGADVSAMVRCAGTPSAP
ncbi:hypothetical protein [Pendulispora albinea]|uniref:PA domain-containing protein n=1 Tax=Pendulispora albinea TaxID=2741071 RepID=A0ABZ2M825_9BACT